MNIREIIGCASAFRRKRFNVANNEAVFYVIVNAKKKHNKCCAFKIWSGKRDSNSRPRPWQGRALPAELFPRGSTIVFTQLLLSSCYSCSVKTGQAALR